MVPKSDRQKVQYSKATDRHKVHYPKRRGKRFSAPKRQVKGISCTYDKFGRIRSPPDKTSHHDGGVLLGPPGGPRVEILLQYFGVACAGLG